ncbi:hypothetical protein GJ496_000251 [Pomphorhynchus laevis]|nr:hypothetical protein GJ496_000251 [Pomphorhynchus laevis]
MLPKTQKRDSICKRRPIDSNCQAVTEKVSKYLNTILNPLVRKEPHCLISTDHFIREFETIISSIPRNCQIVTLDIEQLYTNIPTEMRISACKSKLEAAGIEASEVYKISELLRITLTGNIFMFNNRYWHQTQGTAMGTPMAPSYSNLFLSELETRLINQTETRPWWWHLRFNFIF